MKREDVSAGPLGPWHTVGVEHGLQRLLLSEELQPRRSETKEARPLGRCGQMDRAVTETGLMPLAAAHCTDQLRGDTQAPRCTCERRHRAGQGLAQSTHTHTHSQLTPSLVAACLSLGHALGSSLPSLPRCSANWAELSRAHLVSSLPVTNRLIGNFSKENWMGDTASLLQAVSTPAGSASLGWTYRPPLLSTALLCCLCAHTRCGRARSGTPGRARTLWTRRRVCTRMHICLCTHAHAFLSPRGSSEGRPRSHGAQRTRASGRGTTRPQPWGGTASPPRPGPHGPTVYTAGTASTRSIGFKS